MSDKAHQAPGARASTPSRSMRAGGGPRDRRAGDADLPERVVRLPGHGPRRGALQHRAGRPRVFAPVEPDQRGAGGAHQRAGGRGGRHRDGERAGGNAPRHRHGLFRRRSHRGVPLPLRRFAHLLEYTLPRFGIETAFVDPRSPEAFRDAIRPNTKLLFGETLGNPGLEVLNIRAVGEVAHAAGIALMIDSTFTTPWLCRPFDHGADIVFHSATKFLSGHGIVIGGLVVDGARSSGSLGPLPDADGDLRGLPRPGVRGGVRAAGVHHPGAQGGHPGLRGVHGADDGLPHPARAGDPAAADGAPRREPRAGSRSSSTATRRWSPWAIRNSRAIPTTPSHGKRCPGVPARSSASTSGADGRRGGSSSRA